MVDFKKVYPYSKDLNVLYVEDNEMVRETTLEILKEYFLRLDTAVDGLDGLEKYKVFYADNAYYYDLIITDIQMPRFNGLELSDAVLEINDEQTIIIFSAYSEPEYLFELINLGISNLLYKPLKIDRFNQTLYRAARIIVNRKAERERQKHEKEEKDFLQGVMDLQDNLIVITDGKHIESANRATLDFFDFRTVEDFKKMYDCICFAFICNEEYFHLGLLAEDTLWIEHILHNPQKDYIVMMQNRKTLNNESFKVSVNYFRSKKRYIATFTNITKIALSHQKDKYKATYDSLTAIYNRQSFNDLLQKKLLHNFKTDRFPFVLVMIDIDHFKAVNDIYGHLQGDIVLKQLVKVIKQNIRENDVFARWGGEEFVLILDHLILKNALKVTEHLRQSVEKASFEKVGHLTCSFGVSLYQGDDTINQLIERADKAMYEAKVGGRNQVRYL